MQTTVSANGQFNCDSNVSLKNDTVVQVFPTGPVSYFLCYFKKLKKTRNNNVCTFLLGAEWCFITLSIIASTPRVHLNGSATYVI